MCAAIIMGRGGTGETSEGPQQVRSKSIKERGKGKLSANSKKQAEGKERGRRAVYISSSSQPTGIEESTSDIRVISGLEKSNRSKRAREGDTAEPKPK